MSLGTGIVLANDSTSGEYIADIMLATIYV